MKARCLLVFTALTAGFAIGTSSASPTAVIQGIEDLNSVEKSRTESLSLANTSNRSATAPDVHPLIAALEPTEGLGSVRLDAAHTMNANGTAPSEAIVQQVAPASQRGDKPTAPIQVKLEAGATYSNGSQDLLVTVVPTASAAKLAVKIHGSEGLRVGTGTVDFSDAAHLWTPVQQKVSLRKNGDGRRLLTVTATLEYPDSPPQTAVDTYFLNPNYHGETGSEKPTDSLNPGMRIRLDPAKFKVLEIPAS